MHTLQASGPEIYETKKYEDNKMHVKYCTIIPGILTTTNLNSIPNLYHIP